MDSTNQSDVNSDAIRELEANGFLVQPAWQNVSSGWTYLSPCNPAATLHPDLRSCHHNKTKHSLLGPEWTVSADLAVNTIPFASPGKLGALHLKMQFYDVFADAQGHEANIFLPSFNEFQVGAHPSWHPQPNYLAPMGLESDAHRNIIFIDGFGAHRSRTIEPTVDDHGRTFSTMASCFRVQALQRALGPRAIVPFRNGSGPTAFCRVTGESCCAREQDEYMTSVWSFTRADVGATMLTVNRSEVERLRKPASGWVEQCNPYTVDGLSDFCGNYSLVFDTDPTNDRDFRGNYATCRGPFMLFSRNHSATLVPLYTCGDDRVVAAHSCGLDQTREFLGYAGRTPTTWLPRRLRKCRRESARGGADLVYHTLDAECFQGDTEDGVLGYVV